MTDIMQSGKIILGCNYWASHSGLFMWRDWNEKIVEDDLRQLSKDGIKLVRVFPLWPDFQPIKAIYGAGGRVNEYQSGGIRCSGENEAGLSPKMMERFEIFLGICEKFKIKVVVALITGWMSGRLFVPPGLEGINVLTDPAAIMWQVRFVKSFVARFRKNECIIGWGLGNECNVMAKVESDYQFWLWTYSISSAIRTEDKSRPVQSDMHGLSMDGVWKIKHQGEHNDVLTTHPYPLFTPLCNNAPVSSILPMLHGAAECKYYSSLSGKPCIIEETGTLGPMMSSGDAAAGFGKTTLYSAWANDARTYLWWCAFDQSHIDEPPYNRCALERELGLYYKDRTPKKVLDGLSEAVKKIGNLPFAALPEIKPNAVCLLTKDQEHWPVAFGSYAVCKQAGFELEFQDANENLKDSPLYLMPCVKGYNVIDKDRMDALVAKIYSGASLYISYDGGFLSRFEELTGLEIESYYSSGDVPETDFEKLDGASLFKRDIAFKTCNGCAEVLISEADGAPVFTKHRYGKGMVWFLSCPMEKNYVQGSDLAQKQQVNAACEIYRSFFSSAQGIARKTTKENPLIIISEHDVNEDECILVCINYSDKMQNDILKLDEGWKVEKAWYGKMENNQKSIAIAINAYEMMVILIRTCEKK